MPTNDKEPMIFDNGCTCITCENRREISRAIGAACNSALHPNTALNALIATSGALIAHNTRDDEAARQTCINFSEDLVDATRFNRKLLAQSVRGETPNPEAARAEIDAENARVVAASTPGFKTNGVVGEHPTFPADDSATVARLFNSISASLAGQHRNVVLTTLTNLLGGHIIAEAENADQAARAVDSIADDVGRMVELNWDAIRAQKAAHQAARTGGIDLSDCVGSA